MVDTGRQNQVQTVTFDEAVRTLALPWLCDNHFSSVEWMQVLQKTYGVKLFVKYISRSGKISSYVIYSVVKNFLEEKICVCSYCDYCDCPVADTDDWMRIFQSWQKDFPRYRIAVRSLRDQNVGKIPGMKHLYAEKFHVLDVQDDLDVLWKRAHDSFKAAVNQAGRKGVQVRPGTRADLAKFYELHLKIRKYKYRVFPQPFRFFENIWDAYMARDQGVLLGAFSRSGEFIGGNIYLICGNTLYYKFNTSSLAALEYRPNNLLFWAGIRYAKTRKMDFLDLGSSGCDQKGLIRFKEHTGARGMDIHHYGYAPPDYQFSRKRILKAVTNTLTSRWMPEVVLKWGSDIVYHYLA